MTPLVRTPSPYEYMPSFKITEGSVYKSPIFIKNAETNTVPVINDSCQPDAKKSTNGLIAHDEIVFNTKPTEQLTTNIKSEQKSAVNGVKTTDVPTIENNTTPEELQETKYQPPCFPISPRKRTRSVESAICDIEEKLLRKGVKRTRTRSLGTHTEAPYKLQKLDVKPLKTENNNTSQVPSSKQQQEHKPKEHHRSRDKHEHKSDHHKSKSSHDKKRRCSIGIQARPSHDSGRHYVKLLEPRPSLLESGNLSYPPSDVSRGVGHFRKILYCKKIAKEKNTAQIVKAI